MAIQPTDYLAKKLGAEGRPDIAGSFPTTSQRLDSADRLEAVRDLIEGAFWVLSLFAVWLAVSGVIALIDTAGRVTGEVL